MYLPARPTAGSGKASARALSPILGKNKLLGRQSTGTATGNAGPSETQSVRTERDALIMMKRQPFPIADIYVPVKRRATLNSKTVDDIAESMLQVGQKTPMLVRRDGARLVLVEGLHRLEAQKAGRDRTLWVPGGRAKALGCRIAR